MKLTDNPSMWKHVELTVSENTDMFILFTEVAMVFVVALGFYQTVKSLRKERKKLIKAVSCHVKVAIDALQPIDSEKDECFKRKINTEKNFMPHVPRSQIDDLTYDHIIELMTFFKQKEDKDAESIWNYFHHHSAVHAYAVSFDLDCTRHFHRERKLLLWEGYKLHIKQTVFYAEKVKEILDKKSLPWWQRIFYSPHKRNRPSAVLKNAEDSNPKQT